jgi:protein SCO1/2
MKKIVILAILLVPAIWALFLYTGQHDVSTVPYFGPREAVQQPNGTTDTIYHKIPAYTFDGHNGRKVDNNTFNNSVYVADFIFTTCAEICPKMSTQLMRVQNEFKEFENVKFLTHTVNPKHDTVEVMKNYAEQYGAMDGKWFFVTGDKKEIYDIARYGYFLDVRDGDGGEHDFIHSQDLILVDQNGHIRGIYDGTESFKVNDLIKDIRALQYELSLSLKANGKQ